MVQRLVVARRKPMPVVQRLAVARRKPMPVLRRLVELLSTGGSAAQQHAADALAHAMREPTAKAQIVTTVQESADAKELLAVLADSGNKSLAPQAVQLLESAEPGASRGKRKAELQQNGLAILFNRQKQEGWVVPSEEEEHGWSLCPVYDRDDGGHIHEPQPHRDPHPIKLAARIFVQGHGQGEVLRFLRSSLQIGASAHRIKFDVGEVDCL